MSSEENKFYLLTPSQYNEINEICMEIARFPSWRDFVAESLGLFISWWTSPEKTKDLVAKMWPDVTDKMKKYTQKNFPDFYADMESRSKQKNTTVEFNYFDDNERPLYRLSQGQHEEIKQICIDIKRRYPNWRDFVAEAIELFIAWWRNPVKATELIAKMWPDVTDRMKKVAKMNDLRFYNQMESYTKNNKPAKIAEEHRAIVRLSKSDSQDTERRTEISDEPLVIQQRSQLREMKDDLQNTYDYIKTLENKSTKESADLLVYDGYPLIWSFYSRFFPVKVVISALAHIMYQDKTDYVNLDKFEKRAYSIAVTYSDELHLYENENNSARNEKVSTGLPAPPLGSKKLDDMIKFEASKDRFIQHFVGNRRKDTKYFSGVLIAMGLIQVTDEEKPKVMLSKDGIEFYLILNPIIYNKIYTKPISEEEKEFILEKIIPKFELENILVDTIMKIMRDKRKMKTVKDRNIESEELDKLFEDEILKWIRKNKSAAKNHGIYNLENVESKDLKDKKRAELMRTGIRVATMGRLAEIRAIEWSIEKGKSIYSLPSTSDTKIVAT